tara:strand:+ start:909 stop:1229 length:321 start_codon:yes stop_codon:yes gene_type:complete
MKITKLAIDNILELQKTYGSKGWGLRYGLTGSGCSGYKYVLEFEEAPSDNDVIYEFDKIKLYVDKECLDKLSGSIIGWKESLLEAGFDITNPQAKRPCGCGESVDF